MSLARKAGSAAALVAALAAGPVTLAAQDTLVVIKPTAPATDTVADAPADAVDRAIAVYNDSLTTRLAGSFTLPAGATLTGRVAVFRGHLRVYGRLEGSAAVINGDLIVGAGGVVTGDVFVVGGRVEVLSGGTLTGEREVYDGFASVERKADGLLGPRERRRPLTELAAARASFTYGRINTTLALETGRTYNRVEGLPIVFGPTFSARGPSNVDARLELRGIFRPATDRTQARDDLACRNVS